MTPTILDLLRACGTGHDVRAGGVVFRQASPARHVHLVERGAVRLVRHGPAGEPVVLHEARAGELFAEASIDARVYHCDAVVVEPGHLLRIPGERVRALIRDDADFARDWSSLLARQLRAARARIERLSLRSAADRLRHLLVSDGTGPHCELVVEGTLKDLAHRLGLTHESLYRTLAALERDGTIERGDGRIRFRRRTTTG